jgi:hypothetical protein
MIVLRPVARAKLIGRSLILACLIAPVRVRRINTFSARRVMLGVCLFNRSANELPLFDRALNRSGREKTGGVGRPLPETSPLPSAMALERISGPEPAVGLYLGFGVDYAANYWSTIEELFALGGGPRPTNK